MAPILVLSSQNIQDGYIDFKNSRFISEDDFRKEQKRVKVKKGDLLLTIVGTIGRSCVFDGSIDNIVFQRSVAVLTPKVDIVPFFLRYFIKSKKTLLENEAKGVAQKGIYLKQLSDFKISVPPLQIQQQIVEELDCLTSIIEKQKKQLEELDNLAQSIFYDMFGNPIENEKRWNVKKLGELCKTSSGGTPSKSIAEYFKGDILWLKSGEIKDMYLYDTEIKISDSALKKSSVKIFPVNTVVVAMYGATVGQVGIIKSEMATNQAVCGIFVNNEILSEVYLYYSLKERRDIFLSAAIGGGQPNISQNIIRNTLVSLPPLSLQQQFAAKIEAIEKQKRLIKKSIKETEDLFNSRMDYYFNDF